MFRYEWINNFLTAVFKDEERIGKIKTDDDGMIRFFPKVGKIRPAMHTMTACKKDIEERF